MSETDSDAALEKAMLLQTLAIKAARYRDEMLPGANLEGSDIDDDECSRMEKLLNMQPNELLLYAAALERDYLLLRKAIECDE